jgi:2-dehydro-3-deoxyphosphogluconate aldolase/(4S)-4-hydroxy-2-oxoglutarate aldolase
MRFTKEVIISSMEQTGMIPVFNHADIDIAKHVLEASHKAGVKVFEFTNRGAHSLEVFRELAKFAGQFDRLILGIGTIFSVEEARTFLDAGADFIVSPVFSPSVAAFCNGKEVLWVPGCGTATEIHNARELGAEVVKAFPGNVLGHGFISAVRAVFPDIKFMPTG